MNYETIAVKPIAGALGAEVSGVDLARPLPDATICEIRAALLKHLVIFFHDQQLTPEQHLAVGRRFGTLQVHDFVEAMEGHPEILEVRKEPEETRNFGGGWHTDVSYLERPSLGSILYALEVPDWGGDTLFANQYLAYENLSDRMQQLLGGLRGVSSSTKADASRTREDRIRTDGTAEPRKVLIAEHPAVRTHPETGRKALYVNVAHTVGFAGMTEEESMPLLGFLFRHQIRPEFTCRFRWQPGSLAIWDNRCAQHYAMNDYHGHKRVMHRVTLVGDRPR